MKTSKGIIPYIKESEDVKTTISDEIDDSDFNDLLEDIFSVASHKSKHILHVTKQSFMKISGKDEQQAAEWLDEFGVPLEIDGWYAIKVNMEGSVDR